MEEGKEKGRRNTFEGVKNRRNEKQKQSTSNKTGINESMKQGSKEGNKNR